MIQNYLETVKKYESILTVSQVRTWNELMQNPNVKEEDLQKYINETKPSETKVRSKIRGLEQRISNTKRRIEISKAANAPESHFAPLNQILEQAQNELDTWDAILGKLYDKRG